MTYFSEIGDTSRFKILVIDDSIFTLRLIEKKLRAKHFQVLTAREAESAIKILNATTIDIIITDKVMPTTDGMDIIRHVRENFKRTGIIMMSGHPSVQDAIEAVKRGAEEYLQKPITDDTLFPAVERAIEKLQRQKYVIEEMNDSLPVSHGIIGESEAIKKVIKAIAKAAAIPATVLISGDSGTGKELVARAIHYSSPRANSSFVAVNCSAIPESLLESELFGSVKGAYTGSVETREGYFARAENGTIFLDEISNTSLPMQSKLLRVLQEKEITKVGSNKSQRINVKIVAATNFKLWSLVQKGTFREDLYYRLNVLPIEMPNLAARGNDILLLTNYFAKKYAKEFGRKTPSFTDEALRVLQKYDWPGNVRELENLVQRMIAMSEMSKIDVSDLPSFMRFSISGGSSIHKTLEQVEIEHINLVLESVNGNKTKAAEILGIDRKTLREKLKKSPVKTS